MTPALYAKYEDIAQDMLTEDGELMRNTLQVVGKDGMVHELTLSQLDHFLDTLNGTLPALTDYNPLQFVVYRWQLKDLLAGTKWVAITYRLTFDHDANTLAIQGTQVHSATLTDHPEFDPDIFAPEKEFTYLIEDVGLFGNKAVVNCIAKQAPELAVIEGSFGGSFIYEHKDGKLTLSSLSKEPEDSPVAPEAQGVADLPVDYIHEGHAGFLDEK